MRFVMVPGGWQGGWVFDDVADDLRARDHRVDALTLSGLEQESTALPDSPANLDDHIDQVVRSLEAIDDERVALCGHSYAGLVIAGAADRLNDRIEHLVFLDAYVPESGDSCWTLTSDAFRRIFAAGAAPDGRWVAPPEGMDARARPHPLPSFLQSIRLSGRPTSARRTYVSGGPWTGSPFLELTDRLRRDSEWRVEEIPVGHNIARRDPRALAELLDELTSGRSNR